MKDTVPGLDDQDDPPLPPVNDLFQKREQPNRWEGSSMGGDSSSLLDKVAAFGNRGLDELREYLKSENSGSLQTLILTPGLLHALREEIKNSPAAIRKIRIWGIFDNREQYDYANRYYYTPSEVGGEEDSPEPPTVFRQVVADLKFILQDKPAGQLLDVWFAFGAFTAETDNSGEPLLDGLFTNDNLPLLQKLSVVRFSALSSLGAERWHPWAQQNDLAIIKTNAEQAVLISSQHLYFAILFIIANRQQIPNTPDYRNYNGNACKTTRFSSEKRTQLGISTGKNLSVLRTK